MSYAVTREKGWAVVGLSGEIDLHRSPEARAVILGCLDDGQPTLVDLSAVDYIDSSGVASLVEGLQHARERGLQFGLVGVSATALNVLKLARLDQVFTLYRSLAEIPQAA